MFELSSKKKKERKNATLFLNSNRRMIALHVVTSNFWFSALREAHDITVHIKPLQVMLDEIEQTEFEEVSHAHNSSKVNLS